MHKKILSFLLTVLLLLSLSSCSFKEFSEKLGFLPEEEHLSFPSLGDNRFEFQGNAYYGFPNSPSWNLKESTYIGWCGSQWYRYFVYVDSPDSPMFILFMTPPSLYMREDYDYTTDIFQIEGTDFTFCFCEHLSLTEELYNSDPFKSKSFVIYSTSFPNLQLLLEVTEEDGVIYLSSGHTLMQCSESFIQELKQLGILDVL